MAGRAARFGIGQPVRRREDARFLRGAGAYVDDLRLEGRACAFFLRSPHAHGVLSLIDAAEAKRAPGVLAVWTAADAAAAGVGDLMNQAPLPETAGLAPAAMPPLARERVRFVGQPMAMIIAESLNAARDAAELIETAIEELPPVEMTLEEVLSGAGEAPDLHPEAPGNLAYSWEAGDAAAVAAAFARAAHVVETAATSQRVVVNALEPRACAAAYDRALGRWTLHLASQGVHGQRRLIAEQLGVAEDRLRVMTPDVGGGFGMKLMLHPEYALLAAAARDLGRPVTWTADRSESFLSDAQGRGLESRVAGAFDAEGRLLALRCVSMSDLGAYYSQFGAGVHSEFSAHLLGGMYKVPAMHVSVRGVFTSKTPTDAYRGAGRPEIILVTERLMAAAARRLEIDPAALRRRNLLTAADMPYETALGVKYDSGDCAATLDLVLSAGGYAGFEARAAESAARGRLRGRGLSYYMERTGGGPIENGRIRLRADGRIEAWIGTQSTGQGHETAWTQLIVEKLGVAPEAIDFPPGDSDLLPAGGGTGGSRSLIMAHRVFFQAADHLVAQAKALAAEKLEAAVEDIEFSAEEGGVLRIAGTDRSMDLFAAAALAEDAHGEPAILGEGGVTDRLPTFPNGAHLAEVEIDPETGAWRMLSYAVADDFGRVLNPLLVEGQVQGGAAQGIGQALLEGAAYDAESGQPLTGSFMDYAMPRAADLPMFSLILNEGAPSANNPLGVKGCGEAGSVGATPAASFAVLDALARAGVAEEVLEALAPPFTPQRIWRALQSRTFSGAG